MNYQQDSRIRLEQHIGTILQVLVIALLGWSLQTTVTLQKEVGVLQAKLESLQLTMAQGTNDRYRSTDAARDLRAVWDEMGRLDKRMGNCENRHNGGK